MFYGELFAFTAALLWGTVPIFVRKGLSHGTASVAVILGLLASLPLLVLIFSFHPRSVTEAVTLQAAMWFAAVGVLGSCVGRMFNYLGVARLGAARATPLVSTAPLFTAIFALVFLHEQLTLKLALGVLSVVGGVAVLTGRRR